MKVTFISIFVQHWNLRRILSRDHNRTLHFVYFHTFSYNFKVQQTPTEFGRPVGKRGLQSTVGIVAV